MHKSSISKRSKQGQATKYEHRNTTQAHRGGVRKAKAQLDSDLEGISKATATSTVKGWTSKM